MLKPKECADAWNQIILCYEETRDMGKVSATMERIIDTVGYEVAKETFAVVSCFKIHDGRIYGANRDFMNSVSINHECVERNHSNPMFSEKLDAIHPAAINQLITELRKVG